MGAALSGYLEEPITEKEVTDGISKLGMRYGASTMQGWRVANEVSRKILAIRDASHDASFCHTLC